MAALKIFGLLPLAILLSASATLADTLTGRVVDSNGAPVAGVNIDAFRVSNGNEQNVANDGTNVNGDFTATIAAGVYDLYFFAPPPPGTTHVTRVLRNVVISGTTNMGTVTMQAGVSLRGTARNEAGAPLSRVSLAVTDLETGNEVPLAVSNTSAFGIFNIAVPRNSIELRLDPSNVPLQTLATEVRLLTLTGNTNLGNVVLRDGFVVSGHVQRSSNGTPVANVDFDFFDNATGLKLFTPDDHTDVFGNFSLILAAGSYEIELCAPFSNRLIGRTINRSFTGATNMGNIPMNAGFVLSGAIRSFDGSPLNNADVDVKRDGIKVNTCADNSAPNGTYSVIVPPGSLKVTFQPPGFDLPLGSDIHKNFVVNSDRTLDGTLPPCAAPASYGVGLAGTGGRVPQLTWAGGFPVVGNNAFRLELQNGRGGAAGLVMISIASASLPRLGGTLLVTPGTCCSVFSPMTLGGAAGVAGAGSVSMPFPYLDSILAGTNVFAQVFVQDPQAAQGWAFSEGLRIGVCR